ncbi:MAG: zeta toxin family protein [Alphaproteobacteria bacterium]|nr:zeta toxin family protein [Alphaproteobacteria bacterium]
MLLDSCAPDASGGKPTVYAMAGIPGSGKSTFVHKAIERRYFPKGAFILNPDMVMDLLPAYRQDVNVMGAADAFAKWEMPCRTLAYQLVKEAAVKRVPIIKDMGMVRAENWRILMELRAKGYKVILHHIVCDADVAVERCAARERHFPAHKVYERARELDALMVEFEGVADMVLRFDNSDIKNPYVPLPSIGHTPYLKTA